MTGLVRASLNSLADVLDLAGEAVVALGTLAVTALIADPRPVRPTADPGLRLVPTLPSDVTPRAGGPPTARRTVIESSLLGRGRGAITLTGDIDSVAAEQFVELLDGFLDAGTRTVTVDGTRVRSYHPRVIELLGRAQQRSAARGGAITVTGLHPSRQTDGAPTPAPAEVVRSRVTD